MGSSLERLQLFPTDKGQREGHLHPGRQITGKKLISECSRLARVDGCVPVIPDLWETEAGGTQVKAQPLKLSDLTRNPVSI